MSDRALAGMFKVVTDQNADQAVMVVHPADGGHRHELMLNAAGELVGLDEIWMEAFKGNKAEFGKREQDRITAILHRSGCTHRHRSNGNFWEVPAGFGG